MAATIEAHGSLNEEQLAEAFDQMDSDDSGFITEKDLVDLLGKNVKKSYVEAIIDEADRTQDHQISYEEFLAMWGNEEEETKRKETLERITKRRLARLSSNISATSSMSSMENFLEVEDLTANYSDTSGENQSDHPTSIGTSFSGRQCSNE